MLKSALDVANRARAQIRRPLGSAAQVTVTVVDTQGNVLGLVRTPDAPVFGTDVALQKARTAAFFSSLTAGAQLNALPPANYPTPPSSYVTRRCARSWAIRRRSPTASPTATARSATSRGRSSPTASAARRTARSRSRSRNGASSTTACNSTSCRTSSSRRSSPATMSTGCTGVGALDQRHPDLRRQRADLSRQRAGRRHRRIRRRHRPGRHGGVPRPRQRGEPRSARGIANAPTAIRADTLVPQGEGTRLRYVNCPQAPFNGSSQQNVCAGI